MVDDNVSGFFNVFIYNDFSMQLVQTNHFDSVELTIFGLPPVICEIQMLVHPVHSNT